MPIHEYQCLNKRCKNSKKPVEKIMTVREAVNNTVFCEKCGEQMRQVEFSKVSPFQWGRDGGWT